jgi:phospho-N-acetylmuramoyl-pentapeptide-transferase
MILELIKLLDVKINFLNVLNYISFRSVLAAGTSLLISFLLGPWFIKKLGDLSLSQYIRLDGPEAHLEKKGTPTMGGTLIIISILFSVLLWGDLSNRFILTLIFVLVAFGLIGFIDDLKKIRFKNSDGLSAKWKYILQSIASIATTAMIFITLRDQGNSFSLLIPYLKSTYLQIGVIGFFILSYLVITGSSNAVNLTDGLDGLAIMPTVMITSALAIFAYVSGNQIYANYLNLPYIAGAGEVAIFCAAIAGSGLGFLWFNAYPAEVFMGDIGSLALGAVMGTIAVIVRQEIVLFIMAGLFVAETISVAIQVSYFRLTKKRDGIGKRIFLMAPLHHHYEKKGWKETQVVVRFWIVTMILILVGIASLKIR